MARPCLEKRWGTRDQVCGLGEYSLNVCEALGSVLSIQGKVGQNAKGMPLKSHRSASHYIGLNITYNTYILICNRHIWYIFMENTYIIYIRDI